MVSVAAILFLGLVFMNIHFLLLYAVKLNIGIILDVSLEEKQLRQAVETFIKNREFRTEIVTVWSFLNSSSSVHATKTVNKLINTGIHVIISALHCPQLRTVSVMAEEFKIAHISVNLEPCRTSYFGRMTVDLATRCQKRETVIMDVLSYMEWKKLVLVFDNSVGNIHRKSLVFELSKAGMETSLHTLSDKQTWCPLVKNILMMSSQENLPGLLEKASASKMMGLDYRWTIFTDDLLTNMSGQMLAPHKYSNIVVISNKIRGLDGLASSGSISNQPLTFLESNLAQAVQMCYQAIYNMTVFDQSVMFPRKYSDNWQESLDSRVLISEKLQLACGRSDTKTHGPCSSTEYYIYATRKHSEQVVNKVGEWTIRKGLLIGTNWISLNKFVDFGGATLRVGVSSKNKPFVSRVEGNKTYEGVVIDMMDDLARLLNFSYITLESQDGFYGSRLDNGTWTGLIGMVERGVIDLAAGSFTVTPQRLEAVDFTVGFLNQPLAIMTKKPKFVTDYLQVFKTFSTDVWVKVLVFITAAILFTSVINYLSCPEIRNRTSWRDFIAEDVFLIIGSVFQQGPTYYPKTISVRCFLTFWFLFSLLLMTTYTANLAAVLTVSTPVKAINSLEDLVEQPNIKVLAEYSSSTWELFHNSDNPSHKNIGSRLQRVSKDVVESKEKVKTGEYVLIGDWSDVLYKMLPDCGNLRLAVAEFNSYTMSFVVPKNAPYKEAIDISIQKMVESGIIDRLMKKWFNTARNCSDTDSSHSPMNLKLDRVGGVFIIYTCICGIAIIVLLAEWLIWKARELMQRIT